MQVSGLGFAYDASSARKIQCDGTLPTCMKCDRSQRKCEGYELRLSWPREGDNKRALKGIEAPAVTAIERSNPNVVNPFFVNATSHHMELYGYSALQSHGCHTTPSFPRLLRQPQVGVGSSSMDTDLFHHCKLRNTQYPALVFMVDSRSSSKLCLQIIGHIRSEYLENSKCADEHGPNQKFKFRACSSQCVTFLCFTTPPWAQ